MASSQLGQPTLDTIAPRLLVGEMEHALAFYAQLGFATTYHDEGFAIVERDRIALHFNASDEPPPPKGRLVCWIGVTNIEALYEQYVLTGAVQSPLQVQSWGRKEFSLCDPYRNLLLFGERVEETMFMDQNRQPTLDTIAPHMRVGEMEHALAFYEQLGFATTSRDEGFAIAQRDGISLHFTVSEGHSVCWISVTSIEALYQQYMPTGAIQSPLTSQPWGMKEFYLCDPFRSLLLFGESIPEEESCTEPEA